MLPSVNIVWFKRDLRLRDHRPLKMAIEEGTPMLLIYCFEPSVMADPHYDDRHWRFVYQSLEDMNQQLEQFGGRVYIFRKEVIELIEELRQHITIKKVFSYEESGLKVTYDRDLAFAKYCQNSNIRWAEYQCNGVERGRINRLLWKESWHSFMELPFDSPNWNSFQPFELEESIYASLRGADFSPAPEANSGQVFAEKLNQVQEGGETKAWAYMRSFYDNRAADYSRSISKPHQSRKGCSRLSPYIAWGNLSIRQVYQKYLEAKRKKPFKRPLDNFSSRLRWHCHFIQKFEMEDRMEFENINRGYDSLERKFEPQNFLAWKRGQTGFPLVDACMRCLIQTGYLNFRMRAMLLSFLTHNLWQHWKEGAVWLAKLFLDFEPGIHYPQVQMQAGVTGINTVRIYNPIKQSQEQDEEGIFIKTYLPELKNLPIQFIHEPWLMTRMEQQFYGIELGKDYPLPIIDLKKAAQEARDKIWAKRKEEKVRKESYRILKRHTVPRRRV